MVSSNIGSEDSIQSHLILKQQMKTHNATRRTQILVGSQEMLMTDKLLLWVCLLSNRLEFLELYGSHIPVQSNRSFCSFIK